MHRALAFALAAAFAPAGVLAAEAPATAAVSASTVAAGAPARAPQVELALTDEVLTAFLRAVTPYVTSLDQDLGLGGAARLEVTLTNPSVHVSNAAVKVKVDVRVRDQSGLVDVSGTATPDLQIVAVPQKGILEARFSHLAITLPGGIVVPLEGGLDPIALPGVWRTDVSFGDRVVTAEARAVDVIPENGRARVRAAVELEPKRQAGRR